MSKVMVIPCSGIGKVYGLMAREAALQVVGSLAPDTTETACLAHLVTGDSDALEKVAGKPCITIDGCAALCSAHSVKAAGGNVVAQYRSIDCMRKHKGEKPGTGSDLTADGWAIVDELAQEIADKANEGKGETADA